MNIKELNLEQLDSQELTNIQAGGFFHDLGVAAHNAWNSFNHYMHRHPDLYNHYSKQGI
jgi:hypothetical protein